MKSTRESLDRWSRERSYGALKEDATNVLETNYGYEAQLHPVFEIDVDFDVTTGASSVLITTTQDLNT